MLQRQFVTRFYIRQEEDSEGKIMSIKMIGIDYTTMPLAKREKYSLTKERASDLAREIRDGYGARGVIVISTCNRTEIWTDGFKGNIEQTYFDIIKEENAHVFTHRRSNHAVTYHFELACGMHSQIFGEDQILSQVKNAANTAREEGVSSGTLETLFRLAVTSAKAIKTNVILTDKNASIPGCAVDTVKRLLGSLEGKKCLVIGNGEMGKLSAQLLVESGCEVTVAVRSYHRGAVIIPDRCRALMYEERYNFIPKTDLVFSATLSPHHTVCSDLLKQTGYKEGTMFVDLAIPRDIEETVASLDGATLLNIDDLEVENRRDEAVIARAEEIIQKHIAEFYEWCSKRDIAGDAKMVGQVLSGLCTQKLEGRLGEKCTEKELLEIIAGAVQKSAEKLVFSARGRMDADLFRDAVKQLRVTAEEISV